MAQRLSFFLVLPVWLPFCRGKAAAQRAPRINPATATLSTASIQHLKNQKLDMCVAGLAEMGFTGRRDAAKFVGGELDAAVDLVMGGEYMLTCCCS